MGSHVTWQEQVRTMEQCNNQLFYIYQCSLLQPLQDRMRQIAVAYRDLGFQYHSFPLNVVFDKLVQATVRGFARTQFLVSGTHEMPPMMQLVGMLDHTLRSAATALLHPDDSEEVGKAHSMLAVCETRLDEAEELLHQIQQAVNIYVTAIDVKRMQGSREFEGSENKQRRERYLKDWRVALPAVCWSGYQDG